MGCERRRRRRRRGDGKGRLRENTERGKEERGRWGRDNGAS